jgi:hypothetical protein
VCDGEGQGVGGGGADDWQGVERVRVEGEGGVEQGGGGGDVGGR